LSSQPFASWVDETRHNGRVSRIDLQMDVGELRDPAHAWIDHDELDAASRACLKRFIGFCAGVFS
jgi:hypothetical protein